MQCPLLVSPTARLPAASITGSAHASEGCCQSPDEPGSPRGVASLIGTLSTLNSSLESARALSVEARDPAAPGSLRTAGLGLRIAASDVRGAGVEAQGATRLPPPLVLGRGSAQLHVGSGHKHRCQHHPIPPRSAPQASGSVQLDGSAAQPLLAEPGGHGLRHFMVPLHLHWPDALGHAALAVYLTPQAHADLRQAAAELIAAMPRLGVEGVAALTAALPPILRLADLPAEQLEAALDALLHSGKTLLLQVRMGESAVRGALAERLLAGRCGPAAAARRRDGWLPVRAKRLDKPQASRYEYLYNSSAHLLLFCPAGGAQAV